MTDPQEIIRIFQHQRHDWLNKIQLIKGNLALGKTDRVGRIIEEIVWDMQQEARLTNLKLPKFCILLLTHNWVEQAFQIEYEIINDGDERILVTDDHLTDWTKHFFQKVNIVADPVHDNIMYITVEILRNGHIHLLFHFIGGVNDDRGKFEKQLHQLKADNVICNIQEWNEKEFMIETIFN